MKQTMTTTLHQLDQALYECISGIDILEAVAPVNYKEERARFFQSNFSLNPRFAYNEHNVDLFKTKRALYQLPVESLQDSDLETLYGDIIESYVDKLDQFKSVGTTDFLYDSLRYYGEPSPKDIGNARFILHLPDDLDPRQDTLLDAAVIASRLDVFGQRYGYEYQISLHDSMIANALVSGLRIKVNSSARVTQTELDALAHHELGVHLVTTLNARKQPLRILTLGSPVNTTTQEGLAILCEYLSGNLTLSRLKILALRVLAVQSMMQEKDFKQTFLMLKEQYQVLDEQAFTITARVYRGGGFTKDFLYLQGLHQMMNAYEQRDDFNNLLAGKASLEQLPLITRLIEKGILSAPELISPAIESPQHIDPVKKFIAHAIK
ncbi:MAG: flavohemoglobin expression-modulating QEGLA motif protein [Kangiellaceae bacterium]|nr:flavohemoglobin expression-modulating QEGLA motif protein [Kangiellaceae bacterium]|tara:strand:+ start:597 stop:1733 length:1137 start_codon:yes stop_codon:yes gene_type:complete